MRLKIAARKSDLARLQAYLVGEALLRVEPLVQIEYEFRASFGDQNLDAELSAMGDRGVFTQDFYEDLIRGQFDLVVHSWKDMPIIDRADTMVAATLERADARDLLLVPHVAWREAEDSNSLTVLSSSPRRCYHLQTLLSQLLPNGNKQIKFRPVRGNIPTRLRRSMEQKSGLIVAKAALDRLLTSTQEEFRDCREWIRNYLQQCHWQVLPLRQNPTAPAQGALAIEISRQRQDLAILLKKIHHESTFRTVLREREILAQHGGGCHQKIGVTVLERSFGQLQWVSGLTDAGIELRDWSMVPARARAHWPQAQSQQVFPQQPRDDSWFERRPLEQSLLLTQLQNLDAASGLWVARSSAWPTNWHNHPQRLIWTAGLETWRALALQGVWVNGCAESLGEQELPNLETLAGHQVNWVKLSHQDSLGFGNEQKIFTYQLINKTQTPDLRGKTHFFWRSGSAFQRALSLFPEIIVKGYHGCGPGHTWQTLQNCDQLRHPPQIFLDWQDFMKQVVAVDELNLDRSPHASTFNDSV